MDSLVTSGSWSFLMTWKQECKVDSPLTPNIH